MVLPTKKADPEVSLAVETDGQGLRFVVSDNGRGMPAEIRDTLFTAKVISRKQGGTGLGMAIVHNIVTSALKGSIRLESAPGEGTAVHVTFPRSIPDRNN